MKQRTASHTLRATAMLWMAACALQTFAANDGSVGPTSTGEITVQLTKGDAVRISDLDDMFFGAGTALPPKQHDDICVYSTTGSYTITASSNGNGSGGPQFRMLSATTTQFVRYLVEYRPDTFSQNGDVLTHNVPSATYNNADTVSDTCSGGVNSRLIIEIHAPTFAAATPDTYTDTLTLLVTPI
ncbi:MAG: hypothetical protein AAF513_12730 [Pseudomonadota bacterium]